MEYETKYYNPIKEEMKLKSALRDRKVFIYGIIDQDLAFEVNYYINRIVDLDKQNNQLGEKPITLVINSLGGHVLCGNAIIGLINHLQNKYNYKIIGLVESFAFSMAFDILVNCSERYGYLLSQYMIHQTQTGSEYGDLIESKRMIEFDERQWNQSVDYYVKNTNMTKDFINKVIYEGRNTYFMLADEALKLKIINKIL